MNQKSPNAIKNVTPYKLDDPQRTDAVCQDIQNIMDTLVNKSFGRAVTRQENRDDATYIFPAGFIEDSDYINLMEQDNFDSYSFTRVNDPQVVDAYEDQVRNTMIFDIDLVVWWNLEQVDPTKGYDFSNELIKEVIDNLGTGYKPNIKALTIEEINTEPENIFTGYSLDLANSQCLYFPYRGARFNMEIIYNEVC